MDVEEDGSLFGIDLGPLGILSGIGLVIYNIWRICKKTERKRIYDKYKWFFILWECMTATFAITIYAFSMRKDQFRYYFIASGVIQGILFSFLSMDIGVERMKKQNPLAEHLGTMIGVFGAAYMFFCYPSILFIIGAVLGSI
jgi:hypothetical protein